MSDEKPFAWVAPHRATQGALPPDDDYEVFGWQVVGWPPLAGVFYTQKADAVSAAAEVNSAVAARERKAAARALREAATQFGAKSRTAKWINARAAALEGGAT